MIQGCSLHLHMVLIDVPIVSLLIVLQSVLNIQIRVVQLNATCTAPRQIQLVSILEGEYIGFTLIRLT